LLFFNTPGTCQDRIVSVGSRHYNVFTKGIEKRSAREPVLVFESGMGVGLKNWDKIIDQIAQFAPVFAYDRAGIGKSEKAYQLPTPQLVSEHLHSILKSLNIHPPYILVGHSLGNLYARGFAGHYPDEVSGLVFIDPADFTETKNDWNDIFRKMGIPEKKIDEMLFNRLYNQKSEVDSVNFGPWSERYVLNELRKPILRKFPPYRCLRCRSISLLAASLRFLSRREVKIMIMRCFSISKTTPTWIDGSN
jgi:pimeloyl-ACP methyl ester carboxylesterase